MKNCIILIPIYKETLSSEELFSVENSLNKLKGCKINFIAPKSLNCTFYEKISGVEEFKRFDDEYFLGIKGYNRLLLSKSFYEEFIKYEFLLILQTDAIILKNDLAYWCCQPYDYIGAPWPSPFEIIVSTGCFEGKYAKHVRASVGNGGLSLRRIRKCIDLLEEFPIEREIFTTTGSNEDLFFSIMGMLSTDFLLPNEIVASKFSMECNPEIFYKINGNRMPMGVHAWSKYNLEFWSDVIKY